ncbi:hypothetical protein PNK_1929 [Candidatus Protochlamydia naegleriophila]|uniref:Uncharacterized protein n=1 Tax=Candidatus Protochlamydia naegleriophila TaxID=389348 RepID=A0A0U5JDE6_9BACT|nr:hypothetical protein [Candidatus Protochlamydia naegleriophila]CUI17534.1 hypothetical protein PNK_1929 [Candidatus Protochlamydia naegleriophila]
MPVSKIGYNFNQTEQLSTLPSHHQVSLGSPSSVNPQNLSIQQLSMGTFKNQEQISKARLNLKEQYAGLKQKKICLEKNLHEKMGELELGKDKKAGLEQKSKLLEVVVEELEKSAGHLGQTLEEKSVLHQEEKEQLKFLKGEQKGIRGQAAEARQEMDLLREQVRGIPVRIEECQKARRECMEEIDLLNERLSGIRETQAGIEQASKEGEPFRLTNELKQQTSERAALKDQLDVLQGKVKGENRWFSSIPVIRSIAKFILGIVHRPAIRDLESKLQAIDSRLVCIQQAMAEKERELTEQLSIINTDIEHFTALIENKQHTRDQSETQLGVLNSQLREANGRVHHLEASLVRLTTAEEEAGKEIKNVKGRCDRLNQSLAQLAQDLSLVQTFLEGKSAALDESKRHVKQLDEQVLIEEGIVEQLQADVTVVEKELAAIEEGFHALDAIERSLSQEAKPLQFSSKHVARQVDQKATTELSHAAQLATTVLESKPVQTAVPTAPIDKAFKELGVTLSHTPPVDEHEPPTPLQRFEAPQLRAMGHDPGRLISYEYKNKLSGAVYGRDVVEREDAIKDLNANLLQQLNLLRSDLEIKKASFKENSSIQLSEAIADLEAEIKLCEHSLKNAQQAKGEFVGSQFFRDELQNVADHSTGQKDYADRLNAICLGAPVNFRYQKYEGDEREIGFFRLGVMTDLRNGFTNLAELKVIHAELKSGLSSPTLEKKLSKLREMRKELAMQPESNKAKVLAIDYAIEQLQPEYVRQTIQERRHILNNQMLQLVQGQVARQLVGVVGNPSQTTFSVTHLGLLNRKTDKQDQTGWAHNEAFQMTDMHEIFAEFAGKTLIFDGKGPAIDADGHVHLAQTLIDLSGNPRKLKLETSFVNMTVQGHTKNDGIQQEINKKNMTKLLEAAEKQVLNNPGDKEIQEGLELLNAVQKQLEQGESSYLMAEAFSIALIKLKFPLSMGCLSAKDRTGMVGGRTILNFVKESMYKDPALQSEVMPKGLNKKEQLRFKKAQERKAQILKEHEKQFNKKIISKSGCAALVIYDNTGIKVLKCSAAYLPGITDGAEGKALRLIYYVQQAGTASKGVAKLLSKLGVKGVAVH